MLYFAFKDHQPYSNTINTINRNNYNNNFNKFNNYNNGIPNNTQNNQNQNQNRNNKFNKYQNKRRNGSQGTYGYSHNDNYDLINDRLNKSVIITPTFFKLGLALNKCVYIYFFLFLKVDTE